MTSNLFVNRHDLAVAVSNYLCGLNSNCEAALCAYIELCKSLGEDDCAMWAEKEVNGYLPEDATLPYYRRTNLVKVSSTQEVKFSFEDRSPLLMMPDLTKTGEWDETAIHRYLPKIKGLISRDGGFSVCIRAGLSYFEKQIGGQDVTILNDPTIKVSGDNIYSSKLMFSNIKVFCDSSVIIQMLLEIKKHLQFEFDALVARHKELKEEAKVKDMHESIVISECDNVQIATANGGSTQNIVATSDKTSESTKQPVIKTILKLLLAMSGIIAAAWWLYVKVSVFVSTDDGTTKNTVLFDGEIDVQGR